jgi:hypothetical protein
MKTFEISVEPLLGNTFQPALCLRTEQGESVTFEKYEISGVFESEELALEEARLHALAEAKKLGFVEGDFVIAAI